MNSRQPLRIRISERLEHFEAHNGSLPGIVNAGRRQALIEQIVDGVRRVQFIGQLAARPIAAASQSVESLSFDPLRAALRFKLAGDVDESSWLAFLSIHCGKNLRDGWKLVRDIYGGDGPGREWNWNAVSRNAGAFRVWLAAKATEWTAAGTRAKFGNHRKYETLSDSPNGTGAVVESYVNWVGHNGSHSAHFDDALAQADHNENVAFDLLYQSMHAVRRFGRLARFDYLCMLNKMELVHISPGHPYIDGSTGPLEGAKLLMGSGLASYNRPSAQLAAALDISMQAMEDSLCNWAKSPTKYRRFRG